MNGSPSFALRLGDLLIPLLSPDGPSRCSVSRCSRRLVIIWSNLDEVGTKELSGCGDAHPFMSDDQKQEGAVMDFYFFETLVLLLRYGHSKKMEEKQSFVFNSIEVWLNVWHSCRSPTRLWALQTPVLIWPPRGDKSSNWVTRLITYLWVSTLEPPTFSPSKPPPIKALAPLWPLPSPPRLQVTSSEW